MRHVRFHLPLLLLTGLMLPVGHARSEAPGAGERPETFAHDIWGKVLEEFVDERGFVDYQRLARNRTDLDAYLDLVRRISPDSDPDLFPTRDHELAYWINAYNAQVFLGVLDRGPETESVWTGGLISGRAFFVVRDIVVGGEETNLKDLEDDIIRARYRDPRIHAAINCASISCPRLPRQPFTGPELDAQLDSAMTEFVTRKSNVEVLAQSREVRLNKIFDWFEDDFLDYEQRQGSADPRILDYVNRYRPQGARIDPSFDVEFIPYDKGINAQGAS